MPKKRGRWIEERKRDEFYRMAKSEGYPSRAAYKLIEINEKFKIMKKGDHVLDLGCAPGGWLKVSREAVGEDGFVLGVDLVPTKVEGTHFMRGDIMDEKILDEIVEVHQKKFNVVLSDCAPKLTGFKDLDEARTLLLAERALHIAKNLLKKGGNFVVKFFMGKDFEGFLRKIKGIFSSVKTFKPPASRKRSNEIYIVAKGFKGERK
ncbi:MAG: RlmE family RNA methyltransferase [Candidatus Asgardarchaeia archaeon]